MAAAALDAGSHRSIARLLKINHAGENGAIHIYRAQLLVARWRCGDVVPRLGQMQVHETARFQIFEEAMRARRARPCRLMWLAAAGESCSMRREFAARRLATS